jgi:hypothetical protein
VRPPTVVARAALIAVLALVVVPNVVGSDAHPAAAPDPVLTAFETASLVRGSATTIPALDPRHRSLGALAPDSALAEPVVRPRAPTPVRPAQPAAPPRSVIRNRWRHDAEVSFYGPGFYGKRTACGLAYTRQIMGVAHRTLPCGTRVQFRSRGRVITVPVIDRGPYATGRTWDLSGAACRALDHCWTGPIEWRFA